MKYFFLVLICGLLSCTNTKKENEITKSKVIVIQPLGNFKLDQANKVLIQIKEINPNVILRPNISFPENSYYKPRNRYRADTIIKSLRNNIGNDSVIVGLSNFDVSTTKNGIKDWGIMGLGYRPGKSCVVSDFRMAKKNRDQQFYKVVFHELGHTEGLSHCKTKTCLMRDAEGGNHLDEENDFCDSCKSFLVKKGWNLI